MTLLEINLTDVLSETDPDDRVIVWAPVMREGPAGQLVGPRRKTIPLTDGVGSDEVVPGPLMVQVQCKAMSDTRPREVVVPEEGPVTLTALFDSAGAFTYAPPAIGQVAQLRDEAVQAAIQAAEDSESASVNAAASIIAATTADDDAAQTTLDRIATGQDRVATQDARDQTLTAITGAQLYSGTGFPNGKVTAPVGAIYTDTLATNGAIRWIKATGTDNTGWRVLDGDTGWRSVPGWLINGWTANVFEVKRTRNTVEIRINGLSNSAGTSVTFADIKAGFRLGAERSISAVVQASASVSASMFPLSVTGNAGHLFRAALTPTFTAGIISVVYDTLDPWPATLPGTPV